jgi:hypothetical protein
VQKKPPQTISEIVELAASLPADQAAYASLSASTRKRLRVELEGAVVRLNEVSLALGKIRQPGMVFDPTAPRVIGKLVGDTLLLQPRSPLTAAVEEPFYGAGVYAIYYSGSFDSYLPISGKDHPIYVGKADPKELHAPTPQGQGNRLFARLKDHHRSLSKATNLDVKDFECRFLVVKSAWVETAEDHLIEIFKPVWNKEMKVCYGFGKHGDSPGTRSNQRSPWDTLHSGRKWATTGDNTPNSRTVDHIKKAIAGHFQKHAVNA